MLEVITVMFGLVQSVLILLNRKENWIFYIANIVTLTLFSFTAKLYGDVLENTIYLGIGMLGTLTWYSTAIEKKIFKGKTNSIRHCNKKELLRYTSYIVIITVVVYVWLIKFTDDPQPLLDALTTGMGFTATLMMALKRVEAWAVWLIDDVLMAVVYFLLPEKALYLMALNILWVGLAIGTWYTWNREAQRLNDIKEDKMDTSCNKVTA